MSDSSDKKSRRRRRNLEKLNAVVEMSTSQGLDPADLLTKLPAHQRRLINWLSRHQRSSLDAIAAGLSVTLEEAAAAIEELKREGYVRDVLRDGQVKYRVLFGGRRDRLSDGLPNDIWARISVDRVLFLRQLPLFEGLDESDLRDIADNLNVERHARDDVIIWQGHQIDRVYMIKSGIVGITLIHDVNERHPTILSHLKQGDILGEYSLLADTDLTASATATALTAVEILSLPHGPFLRLLNRFTSVSLGLSRMLVQRLLDMNPKREETETRLAMIFGVGLTQTAMGLALAASLAKDKSTVYTEYPAANNLVTTLDLTVSSTQTRVRHPSGADISIPEIMPSLPMEVRTTLLWDNLSRNYANIIVGVPLRIDSGIAYFLERADQIVLVSTPDSSMWDVMLEMRRELRQYVHPERTTILSVGLRLKEHEADLAVPVAVEHDVPYFGGFETFQVAATAGRIPEELANAAGALADRLGRTNQISVYIPTTISVDQPVDTTPYVERMLAIMGEKFGGATSSQAQGVWNSDELGLVGETVYIVRSYATKVALDTHLTAILSQVEDLKAELAQEAMAVEVNHKLMLI